MPRGQYPIRRSRPVQVPETARARYLRFWPSVLLYHQPEQFPAVTSEALFERAAPLFLDLGSGAGGFANALAARWPEWCVVGVECARRQMELGLVEAEHLGLENVLFLQADALLVVPRIPAGQLHGASLHFPVPYHTSRKNKFHLYGERMFAMLFQALDANGFVSILTDDQEVWTDIRLFLQQHGEWRERTSDEWQLPLDDSLKSHFHRRWENRGRTIWRTEIEKKTDLSLQPNVD